ncbi:MAG: helix-turn-helix domain-containing protein [Angelakisella sp.]|nr:helix-turn-helix domain-containing protein [Angelakisella sp.]
MAKLKKVSLQGETALRIFMLPLRQDILRLLQVHGEAMTAKQIADTLHITPSSAKHHLLKLASIGLVEEDHTELIHGITARYYRRIPAEISMGGDNIDDPSHPKKVAVLRSVVSKILDNFFKHAYTRPQRTATNYGGDIYTGVVHLTPEDAVRLDAMITDFFAEHENPGEGTRPYEYALIAFPAEQTCMKTAKKKQKGEEQQ